MSASVLVTKLFVPRPRANLISRARLTERLNAGLHRTLTLISAPAGFGKTTLLSEWLAGCGRPTAWLSLDEGDSDPARFLIHLVAALQTVAPDVGAGVVEALQSSQPPEAESTLTVLLNEIATLPLSIILVLDDYHAVDAEAVDRALTFLSEHLPPQLHLVIATREDPQLPLARLRARGDLTELRATDLRFTPPEAADFLGGVMGLSLSAEDVAVLEDRTEGWIAGLQLAALSMQGRQDVSGFIEAFAGDHRYIVDYLVDEVLRRQSEEVRSFLLQTSILDRLNGPLSDAVTRQEGSAGRLEALERGNFFVVPLDDRRQWYRYHHLFADVLRTHLRTEQPDAVSTLHQRSSEWYEQNGSASDAIRHALAGGDFARAADLIEPAVPATRQSRQEAMLLGWLEALPDEVVRARPVLSIVYAGTLAVSGRFEGVETRLLDAERWLDPAANVSEMVVVDVEEFRRLPGSVALYRAAQALVGGDMAGTVHHARQAQTLAGEDDHLLRGSAAGLLGLAFWARGDLESGYGWYAECMARVERAGHLADTLGCAIALADIRITQGRLREAMSVYEQALKRVEGHPGPPLRGTADMYVGMSELSRERNDLEGARRLLLRSTELGVFAGLPQNPHRWCIAMARIREAEGDLDGAVDLLCEAERLYVADFFPNVRPVAALKARARVAEGRLDEAVAWAREQGLSVDGDLSYLREFEHVTLARLLLAQYRTERNDRSHREALRLLDRLLQAAKDGERTGTEIEILVLQALAYRTCGNIPAALVPLERALSAAEPEGYIRMFVDEGAPMTALLRESVARGIVPAYARSLLEASNPEPETSTPDAPQPASTVVQPLVDPLSERELDVLRLLRSELSGPEIARELVVALSTVRTHTKRIYEKLEVTSRRAAVKRAAELGLM